MDLERLLEEVSRVALEVGKFQAQQRLTFDRDSVISKRSHDYVSYVDKESEGMIVAALKKVLPEANFITEEKTTEQTAGKAEYVWVVDPLDGTTNYIHDLGPWCVCIGLRHRDEIVLGVVYEVVRDELFYATKGSGAWVKRGGGEPVCLKASSVSDVDQALVLVGYPYDAERFRDFSTAMCSSLYGHCASLRSFGSAEAELCYVAAGRLDVYFESFLQPWDVCAGAIILKEAGGRISDYKGLDTNWQSGRQVLATNGPLHPAMLAIIKNCLPQG